MAYVVEAKGLEEYIKEFDALDDAVALEEAQRYLAKRIKKAKKDYEISDDLVFADIDESEGEYFTYGNGGNEEFLAIWLHKKPETIFDEIRAELERAEYGMTQYQYELMDSCTCTTHLCNIKELLNKLEKED